MTLRVQDTKYPDKEPFEISEEGFLGLQAKFGTRYVSIEKVIVTPDKIIVAPVKKSAAEDKGKVKSR